MHNVILHKIWAIIIIIWYYNIYLHFIIFIGDILYIFNTVHVKLMYLILNAHLFWCLPEDGDLSLQHVG